MDTKYMFTVFTPTFNRARTLPRAYESLSSQTMTDFEWVIVDDGSTDDTEALVSQWQEEASFPIRYVSEGHRGKHYAFNRGAELAAGLLFFPLDSDDAFVPRTLERIKHHWEAIPEDERHGFSGVTALCVDQHGALIGNRFPKDVTDSTAREIRYRFKVKGQKKGCHRTSVLRQFPFPEVEGEQFVPESLVWFRIAKHYRVRYINETLYIYWRDEAQQLDQLTSGSNPGANMKGRCIVCLAVLNEDLAWFRYSPVHFFKAAAGYSRLSFNSGIGLMSQVRALKGPGAIGLYALALPLGLYQAFRDRRR